MCVELVVIWFFGLAEVRTTYTVTHVGIKYAHTRSYRKNEIMVFLRLEKMTIFSSSVLTRSYRSIACVKSFAFRRNQPVSKVQNCVKLQISNRTYMYIYGLISIILYIIKIEFEFMHSSIKL